MALNWQASPRQTLEAGMANSVYQLDWAMEFPDIWPNIILGVSVRGVSGWNEHSSQ